MNPCDAVRIVRLVAAGRTDPEIAAELYVSVSTLRRHLRDVMATLGATNRPHLVRLAHEHGWLVTDPGDDDRRDRLVSSPIEAME